MWNKALMNDEQLLRYSRHVMLAGFDVGGQEALLKARVLIIGAGGLGCPAAMYLASAGTGHIVIVDDDKVDASNLQRQIGHGESDVARYKVDSLRDALLSLNSGIAVTAIRQRFSENTLAKEIAAADVVLDCSDNFSTRFQINQRCVEYRKPLVSGAAVRTEGQLAVFDLRDQGSPCYHCLYDKAVVNEEVNCSSNGVLAPVVGVVGSLQAVEAIKILASYGNLNKGKLLAFDVKSNEWRQLGFRKDPHCPTCGSGG